ncbi:hypothetical protein AZ22_0027 [Bordetella bronchiseptica 980-2]|nr:hypothetical protein AZ22_0027 [Bordetella bronchiseptica 980-2]KCV53193.1 hypothetical protein L491_1829 [Bordetella bronchiseptica 3E44]KCV65796.1 hypothetical protein AZ14_0184 [Bordetella bronchiseptica 980]KDB83594.1 hypothetical protein AZ27_0277 [Bordetella bronchiseptica D756]KDB94271.1 hypothetical protein AZ17_0279 [Bordetella bronchiseptica D989]KDD23436.1 hypothetical protein L526_0352 [Bordetella bronchiseptica MBORD785]KDD35683.1 hypothetical protein L528_0285 [Bordetella bro
MFLPGSRPRFREPVRRAASPAMARLGARSARARRGGPASPAAGWRDQGNP